MSDGWVDLENEETGGTTRIPDDPAVLAAHEGRGWRRVEVPEPGPFVPEKVNVDAGDADAAWVELVHPDIDARHSFPNNPDALRGAEEAGWVPPNKDGTIPKRGKRKTTTEPESPATERGSRTSAPDAEADESTDRPAESAATNEERVTRG